MWNEWVLPHRVLEEDLCLWRKDFYERMQPVIAGKTTTAEVAEAIRYWLWGNGGVGQKRVKFGPAENRQRTPVQALNGGTAACGELAALHVSFLRSVGIPARHCSSGFEQGKDNWHFYTEYWNSQLKCWVAMDDLPLPLAKKVQLGTCRSLVAQAAPGFNSFANAYFTEDYSQLVEVTENLCERELLILKVPSGKNGDGKGAVAVWNSKTWRTVGMANPEVNGTSYQIALSKLKGNELPVLFTIVRDRKLMWSLKNPNGQDGVVDLQAAQPGVCLRWPPANREDDSHGGLQSDP